MERLYKGKIRRYPLCGDTPQRPVRSRLPSIIPFHPAFF